MTLNLPKVACESFRKMKNEGIDNKEKTPFLLYFEK